MNIKIIFFGTSEFGKIILERLIQSEYKPFLVVTTPDMPVGRRQKFVPSPVKILAEYHKILVLQPKKLSGKAITSQTHKVYDLAIVAAYGRILPKEILDLPKYGALNVHPSLLPRWRGPSPIQYAIWKGDKETGVTIIKMDEKIDHGDIVSSIKYQVSRSATSEHLSEELARIGAKLLIDTLPKWFAGEIKPIPQIHENATYTRIITKEDGYVDWQKSAEEVEHQLRAFSPWPGIFTFWNNKRIKILKASVLYTHPIQEPKPQPATILPSKNELLVATGQGVFAIETLQVEGKNEITTKEFLNGHPEIIGKKFKNRPD